MDRSVRPVRLLSGVCGDGDRFAEHLRGVRVSPARLGRRQRRRTRRVLDGCAVVRVVLRHGVSLRPAGHAARRGGFRVRVRRLDRRVRRREPESDMRRHRHRPHRRRRAVRRGGRACGEGRRFAFRVGPAGGSARARRFLPAGASCRRVRHVRVRGGAVTLYTVAGPSMGWGRIAIDGVGRGTFDGYAPSFRTGVAHTFAGLGSGRHTLTVTALGTKVHAAAGSQVGVDAIRWAGSLRRSPTPAGGAWGSVSSASAAGGAYVASDVAGASAQLHFRGTGATSDHRGRAGHGPGADLGGRQARANGGPVRSAPPLRRACNGLGADRPASTGCGSSSSARTPPRARGTPWPWTAGSSASRSEPQPGGRLDRDAPRSRSTSTRRRILPETDRGISSMNSTRRTFL